MDVLVVDELVAVEVKGTTVAVMIGGLALEPAAQAFGRKGGQAPLRGDARQLFDQGTAEPQPEVRQAGEAATEAVELLVGGNHPAAEVALALLVGNFGLEVGHVDRTGTLRGAGLTTQAEVKGFVEARVGKGVGVLVLGEDFAKQVGAAAGAVLFGAESTVRGAHGPAAEFAAVARAVALFRGAEQATVGAEVQGGGVAGNRRIGVVA